MTDIGPHLLGRIPSPPDDRDFTSEFLLTASPLEVALAKLQASKGVAKATKDWALAITQYLEGVTPQPSPTPDPTPTPTPQPTGDVVWTDSKQLDQGNYGTCVGNGWAQWGNSQPVEDNYSEKDARAIYYDATVFDGQPDDPDAPGGGQQGSTVRSGAKAMQKRKRNSAYAFAKTLDDIKTWVQQKGPVVIGSDWTSNMFNPDANGYIVPTGSVEGGHCYLLLGDLESEGAFLFQNSWGNSWGQNGYFKMKYEDFQKLLSSGGEASVSLELPLPASVEELLK